MADHLLHRDMVLQLGDRPPLADVLLKRLALGAVAHVAHAAAQQRVEEAGRPLGNAPFVRAHHPGDDDAVVVDEVKERRRNRRVAEIRRPMAEDLRAHRPVVDLLGGGADAVRRQIAQALAARVDALAAGHRVARVGAFIQLVAGEHVEIGALQMDAMREELLKVAADVVLRQRRAEIVLPSARPARHFKEAAVRAQGRVVRIVGRRVEVIVAVLVVDAEHVAQLLHGVREGLEPRPAAGLPAGRQVIGMLVVVAGLSPAVQMQIQLVNAHALEPANAFFPLGKRRHMVVRLQVLGVIERAFRHAVRLAVHVHHAAAHELADVGVCRSLLAQRVRAALLVDHLPVQAAERHIVAARRHEAVGHRAGIAHLAQRRQMAHVHARRTAGRMVDRIGVVPEVAGVAEIAALRGDLAPPGHVGGFGAHLSVKGHFLAHGLRPVGGQKLALHRVEHGIGALLLGHQRRRPEHFLDIQPRHLERHKRAVHEARRVVYKRLRLKGQRPAPLKARIAHALPLAQTRAIGRPLDGGCAVKANFRSVAQHDARRERRIKRPGLPEGFHKGRVLYAQKRNLILLFHS